MGLYAEYSANSWLGQRLIGSRIIVNKGVVIGRDRNQRKAENYVSLCVCLFQGINMFILKFNMFDAGWVVFLQDHLGAPNTGV